MPERDSYEPGTPSWVDIGTAVDAAKAFYCPLLRREALDAGPPYWSTYVSVADATRRRRGSQPPAAPPLWRRWT